MERRLRRWSADSDWCSALTFPILRLPINWDRRGPNRRCAFPAVPGLEERLGLMEPVESWTKVRGNLLWVATGEKSGRVHFECQMVGCES